MLTKIFSLFERWCKDVHGKEIIVTEDEKNEIILKLLNGWKYSGVWEYYFGK